MNVSDTGAEAMGAVTDPARHALDRLPRSIGHEQWLRRHHAEPDERVRDAAVLMLFGRGQKPRTRAGADEVERLEGMNAADVDVLLLQRASTLRHHPGQVAFPGGGQDPEDADAVAAALREAEEETGVDRSGIEIVGTMDSLYIPVSRFDVTPVIGWWQRPSAVRVMDRAESARVYRVPIADLVAPANRGTFTPPNRAYSTPAFDVGVLRVWGFTAGLLEFALEELGWARDWDRETHIEIQI
ncbi:CoA pyrophosphatase [Brevibacterium daeguense]|uniref:CoA pyrophosphatase n=1 Tax=Brevibacterium daeguense TaxID=909936 RepID=A0ABP8EKY3_9MICO|nr:CoA pyrophosphatase [Brevibacterium daeguense]